MASVSGTAPTWERSPAAFNDPAEAERQVLLHLGVWMFLATVAMLFAAFTSAYIVRRSGPDWRPLPLPPVLWVNSVVLAASSVVLEAGRAAGRRGRWRATRAGMVATGVLGLAFLVGQVSAWQFLLAQGAFLPANPHRSFFFVLTGTHGVHLVAGVLLLLYAAIRIDAANGRRDPRAARGLLSVCATFWHFLGGVWLYVFLLLSMF